MSPSTPKPARLLFFPSPGLGHLIPTIELANRLSAHFSITILTVPSPKSDLAATSSSYLASIAATTPAIQFINLPSVSLPSTDPSLLFESHMPSISAAVSSLPSSPPIAAFFLDLFSTSLIDLAAKLSIPPYLFFTSSAAALGLMLSLPSLHLGSETKDEEPFVHLPTLSSPLPTPAIPSAVANPWFLRHVSRFGEFKGIAINTFAELEPVAIGALIDGRCGERTPPVYPVGPVVAPMKEERHECVTWLDGQPEGSVVFLCFGSMGRLGPGRAAEVAAGLERSGHRFLWCLRDPGPAALPEGFAERTKGRGMVWGRWAPQREILGHAAVGGFVSHCGWNSAVESAAAGVAVLAWPMGAEQRMNGFELAREVGMALEMELEMGRVGREEVERGVRRLMGEEGRRARERAREMSHRAREEGGSAVRAMEALVKELVKNSRLVGSM